MTRRYIYEERQKPNQKTTGYGHIKDTKPEHHWDDDIASVFGKKKALLVVDALNLRECLSNLKKGCTKKDILNLLKEYHITL
ncbi:MAG: hypothetical protein ACK5KL_05160 [Dysgonomonas sp.]